jgi:hypothetical protein
MVVRYSVRVRARPHAQQSIPTKMVAFVGIRSPEGLKVAYIYVDGWLRCGTEGAGSGLTRKEMSSLHSSATFALHPMLGWRKLCVGRIINVGQSHV